MDSTTDFNTSTQQTDTPKSLMDLQINSSDKTMDFQSPLQNRYDSPPASISEAVSPVSSKNRGQLRAASLGIIPTATGGLARPSSSFGAVVDNAPAPIITQVPNPSIATNLEQLREPRPTTQFRSIEETLHSHPQNSNIESEPPARHPHNFMAQSNFGELSDLHSSGEYLSQTLRNGNSDFSVTNPYVQRADEIGPSHHIPGIGHLGDLLIPTGWQEGDAPINPERAHQLFYLARQQAKDKLVSGANQNQHLTEHEKAELNAKLDREWDVKYKLDQVLLIERLNVYEQYQKLEHAKRGPRHDEQKNTANFQAFYPPHPVNPPTNTSFSNSPKPVFPYSPMVFGGRSANNVDLSSSQNHMGSRSFPASTSEFISPSILDPTLLSQTLDTIFRAYQARQSDIARQTFENYEFLTSWVTHYGPHLSQHQLSPGVLPPLNGPRVKPFFGAHDSFPPTGPNGRSIPRPPPYQSPHQYQIQGTSNPLQQLPQNQMYEVPLANGTQPEVPPGFTVPTIRELSYLYDKETGERIRRIHCQPKAGDTNYKQNAKPDMEDNTIPKKKRVAKPTVEKAKPWYHDQVVAANLPTSEISHEAMQAGLDYDPKRTYPSPSKRRNRKPTIDPGKGFPISEKAANILISKGAVDRRPKVSMASFSSTETMTTVAPSSIAPVPGGLSATTFPYLPTPHPTANFVFSRAAIPENSPDRDSSSERADDPKDGDFGNRTTRRKTPNPLKRKTLVEKANNGNKRKTDSSSVSNKRCRPSFDGTIDSSEIDAMNTMGDDDLTAYQQSDYGQDLDQILQH